MTDIILGVLHMCIFPGGLFALAVGLLFKGLDRRVEARLQRRVGPPLIQPLLDIAKLLTKETLIPKTAVRSVFLAAPVVGFAGMPSVRPSSPCPACSAACTTWATCWCSSTCCPSRPSPSCWAARPPARPSAPWASRVRCS